MKAYIATTGTIFGLIVIAHVARIVAEGAHLVSDPAYLALTALAAGLCVWSARLLMTLRTSTARRDG